MNQREELQLREAQGGDPPEILQSLVDALREMIDPAKEGAAGWIRGKGGQELAKSAEIRAKVVEAIEGIRLNRERLLEERRRAQRDHQLEREKARNSHEERMFELKTERLRAAGEALKCAKEAVEGLQRLGVQVDLEILRPFVVAAAQSLAGGADRSR